MTQSTTSWPELAELGTDSRLEALGASLGYEFADPQLLELALTHRSYCAEHVDAEPNERLEFLGDAVLDMAITHDLYANEPDASEGQLAKARAEVVQADTLAAIARSVDLGAALRLGNGEEQSGGRDKTSILADALEAVIGAIYLDRGFEAAKAVIQTLFETVIIRAQSRPGLKDFKTRLQEFAAETGVTAPSYSVSSSGPDHGRRFSSKVTVGLIIGEGTGSSKKQAHQMAAESALLQLQNQIAIEKTNHEG